MGAIEELDDGVAGKVAAVDVDVGDGVVEHPPNVGVEQAPQRVGVVAVAIDEWDCGRRRIGPIGRGGGGGR